jgi:EmrB/QacA subfamily drug resistance transporter
MGARHKNVVMVAMVFAVAMMFIDQTIVALAIPRLQAELHLSAVGAQWIVNGYLIALAATFAVGGRIADILGHRRVLLIGVTGFAVCSALCGATPVGAVAETWMIVFRVLQGVSAALLFPAAMAIVAASYPAGERGRALAGFFSIAGGLTAIGPIAGGYLTEWTWRSIFWINVPVAVIAIVLTLIAKPPQSPQRVRLDGVGALLVGGGMGLAVLGLQQASVWGWHSHTVWGCVVAGVVLLVAFVAWELGRGTDALIPIRLFADRGFAADNLILFLLSICFVPLFFFASIYAQVAIGDSASDAGLYLLVFFGGFAVAAQWGGRILDGYGARIPVTIGCAVAAVGFYLWGTRLSSLSLGSQWPYLALAGAGMGLVLGPVSTDAINRAAQSSYGAVAGVTQTVRNFGGSLGLAALGSVLITQTTTRIQTSLHAAGIPHARAGAIAHTIATASGPIQGGTGQIPTRLANAVALDFAHATHTVVLLMAIVMGAAFIAALVTMPRGRAAQQPLDAGVEFTATTDTPLAADLSISEADQVEADLRPVG